MGACSSWSGYYRSALGVQTASDMRRCGDYGFFDMSFLKVSFTFSSTS